MSVLPSPVAISAMRPWCNRQPPTSCTSKCRMFSSRRAASRTTAKASTMMSSSVAPFRNFNRNSSVFSRMRSAEYSRVNGSSLLTGMTTFVTISSIARDAPVGIEPPTSRANLAGFFNTSATRGRRAARSRTNPGSASSSDTIASLDATFESFAARSRSPASLASAEEGAARAVTTRRDTASRDEARARLDAARGTTCFACRRISRRVDGVPRARAIGAVAAAVAAEQDILALRRARPLSPDRPNRRRGSM